MRFTWKKPGWEKPSSTTRNSSPNWNETDPGIAEVDDASEKLAGMKGE